MSEQQIPQPPVPAPKAKKPIFKRVWFWIIIVLVVLIVAGASCSSGSDEGSSSNSSGEARQEQEAAPVEYMEVTADDLINALNENAARAERDYNNAYIAVTGTISNFDSDGAYINIEGTDPWDFTIIQIYLTDEQSDQVLDYNTGDSIVVRGKITAVGELLGYSINADEIEKL